MTGVMSEEGATDHGSLAELYVAHAPDGIRLAFLLTGDRTLAEESYDLYRAIWDVKLSPPAIQKLLDASDDVPGAKDVKAEQMIDDRLLRDLEASGWLAQHLTPP